jgi:hypothetical protein
MLFFLQKEIPCLILVGGNMITLTAFWIFVIAMLVVFGVDIAQKRRRSTR